MKTYRLLLLAAALVGSAAALLASVSAVAHEEKKSDQPAASAAAQAAYPLTTCVVSDDKLDEDNGMGGPVNYLWKETGKPDRLVRFCCKDCIKDFEKEPAKYLAKLDDAAAAQAKTTPPHQH
jgi:hypothetical protein